MEITATRGYSNGGCIFYVVYVKKLSARASREYRLRKVNNETIAHFNDF
jgi:hypothetical protein